MLIDVTRDTDGLRQAARELLEAAHHAAVKEAAPQFAGEEPATEMADGYYDWVDRLRELGNEIEGGFRPTLQAVEVEGLAVLAAVDAEFRHAHPPCPHCNAALLAAEDTQCWRCGKTFVEETK